MRTKGRTSCILCGCGDPDCEIELFLPKKLAREVESDDLLVAVSPSCLGQVEYLKSVIKKTSTDEFKIVRVTHANLPRSIESFDRPHQMENSRGEVSRHEPSSRYPVYRNWRRDYFRAVIA